MSQYSYPLLSHIHNMYGGVDLSNTLLISSLHLLEPQKVMLEKLGLNAIISGKNYSTNNEIMSELAQNGHIVASHSNMFDPHQSFDTWYPTKLGEFVREQLENHDLKRYDKVIVLEDGGYLHLLVNELVEDVSNVIGIEQTSSGHHKIVAGNIRFPFISVARSYHKLFLESPYIGRLGAYRIRQHQQKRNRRNPKILCFGLGPIGRQIAGQLLVVEQFAGYACDPLIQADRLSPHGSIDLLRHRHRIIDLDEAMKRIGEFDIIIGSTGTTLFGKNMIERLHPEVSIISVSSSDREFPSVDFRREAKGIHDDYTLDAKCLVNGGFPITFYGDRNCIPPQQIELTLALMMLRLLDAVKPLYPLEYVIDQLVGMWQPDENVDKWYEENLQ